MRPKKPESRRMRELLQAGEEQLVLHDAVLEAGAARLLGQRDGDAEVVGDRLLAVDVLAGVERLRQQLGAHQRGAGVEEDGVVGVGERGVEVGAPALDAVLLRQRLHLVGVAADDDRVDLEPLAGGELDAALVADRQDRAHQVLVVAHASGDAVHDDADAVHAVLPLAWLPARVQAPTRCVTVWLLSGRDRRGLSTASYFGEHRTLARTTWTTCASQAASWSGAPSSRPKITESVYWFER